MKELKIYTVAQTAALLQVKRRTVYRLIARGVLECVPFVRHKRIKADSLERLAASNDESALRKGGV